MRIAFIDYVFSWPPLGGAPADVYYTLRGLQDIGHDVHLFFGIDQDNAFTNEVDTSALPFPSTQVDFTRKSYTPAQAPALYRDAVDAWKPDVVFQCFGFFMKPYVSEAFSGYPQVARYYAYEPFCPRDYRLFKDFQTCPHNYLRTPNICRRCTFKQVWRQVRTGRPDGYVSEYLATKAYSGDYYRRMIQSLRDYKAIIVYNHFTKDLLHGLNDNVHVVGGGVHLDEFDYVPLPEEGRSGKTVVLMTGRVEDPSKGGKSLKQAGEILARERDDFEIHVTSEDQREETPWYKPIGWHPFSRIKEFYKQADVCVFPSTWEEPFGLVAVEAMATGRPVVVGDVGGLQEIVVQDETGYIFPRGNGEALADCLRKLLDSAARRKQFGDAGRRRVEEQYAWEQVIRRHYPPLLEQVTS